jgi:hypothetical protein
MLDMRATGAAKDNDLATLAANSSNPYFRALKLRRRLEFAD